jgi:fructose-1,6-bisphosphatase/sedoheptulose 1,7-bisphosphatase-like protein
METLESKTKEMWTVWAPLSVRHDLRILAAHSGKKMGDLLAEILAKERQEAVGR